MSEQETIEMRIIAGKVSTERVSTDVPKWNDERVLGLAAEMNNEVNLQDFTVERTNEAIIVRPKAQYG